MKIYRFPTEEQVREIITRPTKDAKDLTATVSAVLARIKSEGDAAVLDYERLFDKVELKALAVTDEEFAAAEALVSAELKAALQLAHDNIARFHEAQRYSGIDVETSPGVRCWQKSVPIERVGLYIPGGTAPLFSTVLMLATPARIAGCSEIVLCTPPQKDGSVHPAILMAARIAGVSKVFKAGGVQAIGALAYGTESVPKVFKIFGPGNQYVQCAKQLVSLADVAIDMPAGPSEVEVIADETANPAFVAADLLSQAEHGMDSQVLLVTTSESMIAAVEAEVSKQLAALPRRRLQQPPSPTPAWSSLAHPPRHSPSPTAMPRSISSSKPQMPKHWQRKWSTQAASSSDTSHQRAPATTPLEPTTPCPQTAMPQPIAV